MTSPVAGLMTSLVSFFSAPHHAPAIHICSSAMNLPSPPNSKGHRWVFSGPNEEGRILGQNPHVLAPHLIRMAKRVGMAQQTAQTLSTRPPRLLIIAGATGVGKSTAAVGVANRAGFTRVMSTDAIREIMRAADEDQQREALTARPFERKQGEPVLDWNETCLALKRASRPPLNGLEGGIDLLLEGFTSCRVHACSRRGKTPGAWPWAW